MKFNIHASTLTLLILIVIVEEISQKHKSRPNEERLLLSLSLAYQFIILKSQF